jgi:hypothetical protein
LAISRSTRADRPRRAGVAAGLGVGGALAAAAPAAAHGFGQRYDLPLPLDLYLFGAAAAVAVSFVVVGLFVRGAARPAGYPRWPRAWLQGAPWLTAAARLLGAALLALVLVAGFIGDANPFRNIAPTLVWIIAWVGVVYVSAFLGDVWRALNPWAAWFDAASWLWRRATGRALAPRRGYPAWLDAWPAVVLLLAVAWIELVYPAPAVPRTIAWLLAGYTLVALAGMVAFGRDAWLAHGEVFGVLFGLFARFAPSEPGALRPFGAGLLAERAVSTARMAFVLLVLSSVLYDGILGAPEWSTVEAALPLPLFGAYGALALRTAGLVASWLVVLGAYLAASAAMSRMVGGAPSALAMARRFALTLVPIAIGYHLAHYLTFLLIQGQYVVPLASDPFGFGWDLFGTAGYRVEVAVVGARFAWYAAVLAILIGHIAAVYLAHLTALRSLPARGAALRSQVPLTALMVLYTVVSLSILAEPIVERRAPAPPSAPVAAVGVAADALLPAPGTGALQPVGPGRQAKQRLTYRVMASAFHDGTHTGAADLLYALAFAYRWGADPAAPTYDPVVDRATAPLRRALIGVRLAGTDTASRSFRVGDVEFVRELFIVDVWLDSPPIDPDQDAALAPPWSTVPWHVLALMEAAVARGWAAFSEAEAARRHVPWLDLVRDGEVTARLADLVDDFARDGWRPPALETLVTADAARRRWTALAAFYRAHRHFLVTNGPYQLKAWSQDGATLAAFRDLSYPLGVGSYDGYATPRRGYITKVERDGDRVILSADVELIETMQRDYRIVREPMRIPDPLRRRAAAECRYRVLDDAGQVVLAGTAAPTAQSNFQIDLAGKLAPGTYTLAAMIALNGNAMNAEITRVPIIIGP